MTIHLLGCNAMKTGESQLMFQRRHVPPNRQSTFNGLCGVVPQSGHHEEEKNPHPCWELNLNHPAHSL